MPGRHSAKQKRQAKHIAESERKRGVDPKRAESIGWATVNKQKSVEKGSQRPVGQLVSFTPNKAGTVARSKTDRGSYKIKSPNGPHGDQHVVTHRAPGLLGKKSKVGTFKTTYEAADAAEDHYVGVRKGPGFKPTPIESRTKNAPAKKPIGLEIGPATVTSLGPPKKPMSLDIGPATVTTMPKQKPITLDIGPATVTPVPPKPTLVARRSVNKGDTVAMPSRPTSDADRAQVAASKPNKTNLRVQTPVTYQGKKYTVTEPASSWVDRKVRAEAAVAPKPIQPGSIASRAAVRRPSTPAPSGVQATLSTMPRRSAIVGKAVLDLDAQHQALTEKLRRRAQGGGKRSARRAQIAAFGKGINGKDNSMGKSLKVLSIGDYYDSMNKAEGAPVPGAPKKFPRKLKPMAKMKPVSDQDAVANLRAGKSTTKSMVMLAAIKALVSGYGKVSGGGALRAPNRGFPIVGNLQRAMEAMPKPKGPVPPATVYLPGAHGPEVKDRAAKMRAKTSKRTAKSDHYLAKMEGMAEAIASVDAEDRAAAKKLKAPKPAPAPKAPPKPSTSPGANPSGAAGPKMTVGKGSRGVANSMSADEEPTLKKKQNVVNKAEGDASMSKTNFNDLFKSELGVANDDVLVDCPHCEAPITKSDLAKAHKGKGAVTHVSGPHQVEADAHVVKQNPHGGTMRGGEGRGTLTPSRGVPGAKKTDAVAGVQNSKGSKAHKAMDDSSSCADDASSGDAASSSSKPPMKKSLGPTYRGTEFVQYIDYGDAPGSDASIAKSIAEAQGQLGQQATQPMDLNNDLSRLLV
jgi:hypothetical protein